MSGRSRIRKSKQKQRSLDCQKRLKLELKESQAALEGERKLSSILQRYYKVNALQCLIQNFCAGPASGGYPIELVAV